MNPWGTLNDWQLFEVDDRVARYGRTRRHRRTDAGTATIGTVRRRRPRTTQTLGRDDVAACA